MMALCKGKTIRVYAIIEQRGKRAYLIEKSGGGGRHINRLVNSKKDIAFIESTFSYTTRNSGQYYNEYAWVTNGIVEVPATNREGAKLLLKQQSL